MRTRSGADPVGPAFYALAIVISLFSGITSVTLILAVAVYYAVETKSRR